MLVVKPEKKDEHLDWMWHWKGLKNKTIDEYQQKMLLAKKNDQKLLRKERDEKWRNFLKNLVYCRCFVLIFVGVFKIE